MPELMDTTHIVTDRAGRWDSSFDPEMSDTEVAMLINLSPFKEMDPAKFPKRSPLRGIIRHETRIRRFKLGEFIVRAGDYGNSAFLVLSGELRVVIDPPLPDSVIGRSRPHRKGFFEAVAQLWRNHDQPEVRTEHDLSFDGELLTGTSLSSGQVGLRNVPAVLKAYRTEGHGPGQFLGEIAALTRVPRTATIFANSAETEVLEIRWQGLRDLLKYDRRLREYIDGIYRTNALSSQLRGIPMFAHLSETELQKIQDATEFFTYGDYEWSGDYKKMARAGKTGVEKETVIAQEGDYPNGIFLLRSGFARLSHKHGSGHRTLNYLGAGREFGLREIVHNWRNREHTVPFLNSLRVVGYTHLLFIPTAIIESVVLPGLPKALNPEQIVLDKLDEKDETPMENAGQWIGPDMLEFLAENRFFNGTAAMAIDLDRCTRCDDCVRACAATHDNNPRFLRHGPSSGNIMIANACMHCADPVCLIGCPTGAIHREVGGGKVVVNQATCIGCNFCANNCPYDAIRMVETREESGGFRVDAGMKPITKATKCDLCTEQRSGPACESACPHDALKRINLNDLSDFARWLNR